MTLVEDLMVKASEYLPPDKMSSIEEAYRFAEAAHEGQVRKSGEPFIEHPLNTALYLADLKLDSTALTAALLHDVMEDCDVPFDELSERFGNDVAKLVARARLIAREVEHRAKPLVGRGLGLGCAFER